MTAFAKPKNAKWTMGMFMVVWDVPSGCRPTFGIWGPKKYLKKYTSFLSDKVDARIDIDGNRRNFELNTKEMTLGQLAPTGQKSDRAKVLYLYGILDKSLLKSLQHGSALSLTVDGVSLFYSLRGSASAIGEAADNCVNY